MKRLLTLIAVCLVLTGMLTVPNHGQTADEIIKKMIDAQGGKAVYESIKDITITGTAELVQQGIEGTLTVYKKEPDKRRQNFEVMGLNLIESYDGKIGWWTNQQTLEIEDMPEDRLVRAKRNAMPVVAPLYPDKYGLTHTLKGKEDLEGREYFVVIRKYPDEFEVTMYIDTQTYLPYKSISQVEAQGVALEVEQYTTDYKSIQGLKVAHSTSQYLNGQEQMILTVTEVKINTGLDDSLFAMEK
jgi:outer membrane lipoprotein-sorting protein